jgi:transglutaminase-like putative cysteine protease
VLDSPLVAALRRLPRVRRRVVHAGAPACSRRSRRCAPGSTPTSSTRPDRPRSRPRSPRCSSSAKGVCQDFAHVGIACLRSIGLPARYVSGYLETDPPPGRPKLTGVDGSHAWLSVLVPDAGWVDVDPTNDQFVGSRYVVTAIGRDYGDVPPMNGVIYTEGKTESLRVLVDVVALPD